MYFLYCNFICIKTKWSYSSDLSIYSIVTNIQRNDCRLLHRGIIIFQRKIEDSNYSGLIWLPPYLKYIKQFNLFQNIYLIFNVEDYFSANWLNHYKLQQRLKFGWKLILHSQLVQTFPISDFFPLINKHWKNKKMIKLLKVILVFVSSLDPTNETSSEP